MPGVSIGITAMELFAYNPFRILGVPVNASHSDIKDQYENLLSLAATGDVNTFSTVFDFDSLPPFSRSTQTLKTAHAKLASNGYRCFAYADGQFTVSLSIDDIMLNLRDISCYDCFLRCYMWLIVNDRDMQEHDLWIMLANYIDKLIMSEPEDWEKYFDNRFPQEMIDDNMLAYKSFYTTFCEIILLPLKEMVRGSMKCRSAKEILECAGIDVNEKFDYIDIPQSNVPKNDEPQPKLKLALKYGDEYFDISTGKMKSYNEVTSANESNSFTEEVNAPLAAEVFTEEPTEEPVEQPSSEQSEPAEEIPAPAPAPAQTAQTPVPVKDESRPAEPIQPVIKPRTRAERRAEREAQSATNEKAAIKPTELVAPKVEPLKLDDVEESSPTITLQRPSQAQAQTQPSQPAAKPAESTPRRQRRTLNIDSSAAGQPAARSAQSGTAQGGFSNPFMKKSEPKAEAAQPAPAPARQSSFASVVQEAAEAEKEAMADDLGYEDDSDESMYTNALVEILKSSTTHGETMKSVDTSRVVSAKEMAGPSHTTASMDDIDLNKYDAKLLNSQQNAERKMTREERYRNIKIDDMLGTNTQGKNFGVSAIDEYKKAKEQQKKNMRSMFKLIGGIALIAAILLVLFLLGII